MMDWFLKNKKEMMVSAAVVVAAVAVHGFGEQPKRKSLQKARTSMKQLSAQVERSSIAVNEMTTLISTRADILDTPITSRADVLPALLNAIADEGEKHNVEILSVQPNEIENVEIRGDGQTAFDTESLKLVVSVRVKARYRNLGDYLKSLDAIPVLVAVKNLRIMRNDSQSPIITATFDIETYTILTEQ